MMETREPLEWHFKQLDHSMGLSFKTNFNFAIVGHLLKGLASVFHRALSVLMTSFSWLLSVTALSGGRSH